MITITTSNVSNPLYSYNELPEAQKGEFDYVKPEQYDEKRFVFHNTNCYDVDDTQMIMVQKEHTAPVGWAMYVDSTDPLATWHRVTSEGYFSGVVFKILSCRERVVVGNYFG